MSSSAPLVLSLSRPSARLTASRPSCYVADVLGRLRQPLGLRERNAGAVLVRATGAQLVARKRRECRRVLLSFLIVIVIGDDGD